MLIDGGKYIILFDVDFDSELFRGTARKKIGSRFLHMEKKNQICYHSFIMINGKYIINKPVKEFISQ